MKRTLWVIMLLFLCANVFAGNGNTVKLLAGSVDVLKEDATALLEFDYTNTTWEENDDYKTWCGTDYDERVLLSKSAFELTFNATSNGLKITKGQDAKYKIVFRVIDLEQHQPFRGGWGQMQMEVTSKIDVINIATGENVLRLQLTTIQGKPDYSIADRIKKAFSNVAERLFGKIK